MAQISGQTVTVVTVNPVSVAMRARDVTPEERTFSRTRQAFPTRTSFWLSGVRDLGWGQDALLCHQHLPRRAVAPLWQFGPRAPRTG